MVTLQDYEWADLIDNQDMVRTLISPESTYAKAAAAAMGRAIDDEIVAAAFASSSTGKDGSASTAHPSSQQIAVGSPAAGLTIAKLVNAKKILDANTVDPSIPRYIAVSPEQIEDLLNNTTVTSSDYNTVRALVQGDIDTFVGFKFITTTRLAVNGSSQRRCIAWAQDGIKLAVGKDVTARISERDDKSYSTQVYYCMSVGVTRMEEEKVCEIICAE